MPSILFVDGPSEGICFNHERDPLFLRITQNGITFRCLAGFGDEPEETELIYVYRRCNRANGTSNYAFINPQPFDPMIRETHSWRGWAERQIQSEKHLNNSLK